MPFVRDILTSVLSCLNVQNGYECSHDFKIQDYSLMYLKKKNYTHKSMKKKDCLTSNFDTPGFKFEISQYSTESVIKS